MFLFLSNSSVVKEAVTFTLTEPKLGAEAKSEELLVTQEQNQKTEDRLVSFTH